MLASAYQIRLLPQHGTLTAGHRMRSGWPELRGTPHADFLSRLGDERMRARLTRLHSYLRRKDVSISTLAVMRDIGEPFITGQNERPFLRINTIIVDS